MITAATIAFVKWNPPRFVVVLGAISYSMYLLHVPIGGRVINLGLRLPYSLTARLVFLFLAVAISVLASYAFYRLLERPSQHWSASIRYRAATRDGGDRSPAVPPFPGSPDTEPSL
jgi:peptidoglycan/LPS O-acetylase OafA/YrhL